MPRNYVDNAYNRSVGRVGMPVGSAVISSGSSASSYNFGGGYSSSGGGGYSGGGGGYPSGGGNYSSSSYSTPRTYVDNSMNRSLGRVGMPLGSAVHSTSSGSTSSSSARTYVDNSANRSLGRVGLPLGSAVHSRSTDEGTSARTYVDNSMNRSLGRVGLPLGSDVHSSSRSSNEGMSTSSSSARTYVDNPMNRSLGRVGLPLGTAVHSKNSVAVSSGKSERKTYVDNDYNRKLGRVGLTYGSALSSMTSQGQGESKTYVDNAYNRRLGRVGKPLGSCPVSKNTGQSNRQAKHDIYEPLQNFDWEDDDISQAMEQIQQYKCCMDKSQSHLAEKAIEVLNRHEATKAFSKRNLSIPPSWVRGGQIIEYDELSLGEKVGGGGFGDVYAAIWKGRQVAVKKLRVQRVSQEKKRRFQEEVLIYSELEHENIVQFYGVCVTPPNLAIVMEFMSGGSLYDVLHVEARRVEKKTKLEMFMDCVKALEYLHKNGYAHRDLKTMNILVTDDFLHCKLSDFGLALKENARSSASVADHAAVGTIRYSPPEVVQGDRLTLEQFKQADIYSLGVVGVELMTEEEPYDDLNQFQVRKAILDGELPDMGKILDGEIKRLLEKCLKRNRRERPTATGLREEWKECSGMNL